MNKSYMERAAAGICVSCGKNPAREGQKRCAECSAKQKQFNLERRERLLKAHCCTNCGAQLPEGWYYTLCRRCKDVNSRLCAELRARRKAAGLCPKCGARVTDKSHALCPLCRKKQREDYYSMGGSKRSPDRSTYSRY